MEPYINGTRLDRVAFGSGDTTIDINLDGFSRFSMVIPAALNGLTATFQAYDFVASAWVTTSQTQVLATGFWVPSATQLAALVSLNKFRMALSGGASAAGSLQVSLKT
jgi:hypothetical protein